MPQNIRLWVVIWNMYSLLEPESVQVCVSVCCVFVWVRVHVWEGGVNVFGCGVEIYKGFRRCSTSVFKEEESESEVARSCPTLCNSIDCSPAGSSVNGIFQARMLEWVAISFSRGSSQPRDRSRVSHIVGRCFTIWNLKLVETRRLIEVFETSPCYFTISSQPENCELNDHAYCLYTSYPESHWGMWAFEHKLPVLFAWYLQ